MTFNDLCLGALRLLGAVAPGEPLSAEDQQTGLEAFNAMLDSWSLEELSVYTLSDSVYPFISGKRDYTLGPGGDFDSVRPNKIASMQVRITTVQVPYDLPIKMVNDTEWAQITLKTLQGPWPYLAYDRGDYPLRTLSFFPTPAQANSVVIWTWNKLTRLKSANQALKFPDGYERALRYNLALELSPEYQDSVVTPMMAKIASEAKANIARLNEPDLTMTCESVDTENVATWASNYSAIRMG